jgi:hypothetical protein
MDQEKSQELARVLGAASEQIGLALLDSHAAVETLGASLERLAALLGQDLTRPEVTAELAGLRAEMAHAVTALQFYDRMTQHLSHVRDYLAGTVEQLASASGTFESINRQLAERLLTDTHRIHLGRNFAVDFLTTRDKRNGKAAGEPALAPQGDIDLF